MKLTYREAYDKIVDAYFKNELNPFKNCACFIGNLLGSDEWQHCRNVLYTEDQYKHSIQFITSFGYSYKNICDMEDAFLRIIFSKTLNISPAKPRSTSHLMIDRESKNYEDGLFEAMSSTLDMLKKIHEENGEIVDAPVFKKRTLQPCE